MTKRFRSAIAFAALSTLLAACSEIPLEPGARDAQFETIAGESDPTSALHYVIVNVTGSGGVPGVLVTATNTQTGEYILAFTDAIGRAKFNLPNGPYLFHARNLSDAGPALPQYGGLRLAIAPLPDNVPLLNTTATQHMNHTSALYTPGGSIPMTPLNYSALSQQPPLVLAGSATTQVLNIAFQSGATLTCDLIDAAANPVVLGAPENVFIILPVDPALPMPPVPQPLQGLRLPRGLLTTATTVVPGSNQCSVAGIMATPAGGAIVETNSVPLNGEEMVFINAVEVTNTQAAGGATIGTLMVAEPRRSFTHYVTDPWGDNPGTTDVGLVTGGWLFRNGAETDEFVVAARFRGLGQYILEIGYHDGTHVLTHQIRATCSSSSNVCRLNNGGPRLPDGLLLAVEGAHGVMNGHAEGTVIWRLNLPGVSEIDVRVFTGQPNKYDSAPNGPQPTRMKRGGNGNTWIIPS